MMPERRWRVTARGRGLFAIRGGRGAAGSGSCSGRRSTRCSASTRPNARAMSTPVDSSGNLVAVMDDLYAVGGPVAAGGCGRYSRRWIWRLA